MKNHVPTYYLLYFMMQLYITHPYDLTSPFSAYIRFSELGRFWGNCLGSGLSGVTGETSCCLKRICSKDRLQPPETSIASTCPMGQQIVTITIQLTNQSHRTHQFNAQQVSTASHPNNRDHHVQTHFRNQSCQGDCHCCL